MARRLELSLAEDSPTDFRTKKPNFPPNLSEFRDETKGAVPSALPTPKSAKNNEELFKDTMVENGIRHRQNSHLIIHFLTSEGVSEVSERANE